jgi:hypothetical protein
LVGTLGCVDEILIFCLNHAYFQADQNQAISMVSYYASSSEPAQVRGKTVYIQYSNRQEITNNKGTGDSSGNVLLVTFEGVQPNDITIEVIHLVSVPYMHMTCILILLATTYRATCCITWLV